MTSLEEHVKRHPELGYQLQNARGEVEEAVGGSEKRLRGWLNAMFGGGVTKEEEGVVMAFDPWKGVDVSKLEEVGVSPLVSEEIMDFYGMLFFFFSFLNCYHSHDLAKVMSNWHRT